VLFGNVVAQRVGTLFLLTDGIIGACALMVACCREDSLSVPTGEAFYVALNGNDSWVGDLAAPNAAGTDGPFANLARAQQAMEASSIKTTYVEGGTYHLTSTLTLTSADNGENWRHYPAGEVDRTILDGGATSGTTGTTWGMVINGGSNITVDGLEFQHFTYAGIAVHGGAMFENQFPAVGTADSNVIENNMIHDLFSASASNGNGGNIYIEGQATNTKIYNNVTYNNTGMGITVHADSDGNTPKDTISGTDIQNNVILNVNTSDTDSGAIYMQDVTHASTSIMIKNNFIRDYGSNNCKGIYLDDGLSNATVTQNIVTGIGGTYAVQFHGGNNDYVSGNIFDLGNTGSLYAVLYQSSRLGLPMTDNGITGNIIIGNFAGTGSYSGNVVYFAASPSASYPTVRDNAYHNYNASARNDAPSGGTSNNLIYDTNPQYIDPQISGWTYTIAPGSPVFSGPVMFPGILGNWGPPGYIIPRTGSAPSYRLMH
jgi:hypothetical protein